MTGLALSSVEGLLEGFQKPLHKRHYTCEVLSYGKAIARIHGGEWMK